ncbi:MAG: DUF885 domain-containing protein [Pseudomonadota bacterium]
MAPQTATEDGRLIAFLDALWEERVALSPEYQTRLGRKTNYGQWDDRSQNAQTMRAKILEEHIHKVRSNFDRDNLSTEGQRNYDLFLYDLERRLGLDRFDNRDFRLSQLRGAHTSIPVFLANYHKIESSADAEAYLQRISGVPRVLEEEGIRLERQASEGFTLPAFSYPLIAEAARNAAPGEPIKRDFQRKLTRVDLSADERQSLITQLDQAITEVYKPAYEAFASRVDALAQSSATHGNFGIKRFDRDGSYYATLLSNYTTTDLSANEIHDIGLAEVSRIHTEMLAITETVGFAGSLQEFFVFMRTSDRFFLPDSDEGRKTYLEMARTFITDFSPKLDELFTLRPKASVEVRRVEPFRERSAGKAFYAQPDAEGTRPGYFYANLGRMGDMPTYQLEALVYHEAIPGHHMQRALQLEQKGLPKFRRFGNATAYTEGWGLYSERLPKEIGFYDDPYSDFGRLAMELWRAARLVVDTGLHAKGWEMDEAISYLTENTPNPRGDAVKAIERYIVRPGQATAYTVGMLKLLELREQARAELGDAFDIRAFHDRILRAGPLPLAYLEQDIDRWIADQKD